MKTIAQIQQAALTYTSFGINVVLLGDAGTSYSKRPRFKSWGAQATSDEEILASQFEQYPKSNVGALLGPTGGVIDIEFDSDEGRETADRLFGDSTVTPTYRSRRSVHRLFKWSDKLPNKQKMEIDGLEIRIGGGNAQTQSVLPPSMHESGERYEWLPGLSIFEVELAEVPESVLLMIANQGGSVAAAGSSDWHEQQEGVEEGGRNMALAQMVGVWLVRLTDEEIEDRDRLREVWLTALGWNAQNKPPLDEAEVRRVFESILRRERERRLSQATEQIVRGDLGSEVEEITGGGEGGDGNESGVPREVAGFRLEIIQSDPPVFRLYSRVFRDAGGVIELTAAQVHSFTAVRTAALAQSQFLLSKQLARTWDQTLTQLMHTARRLDPDPELHRPSIIAAVILENAAGTHPLEEREVYENGVTGFYGVTLIEGGRIAVSSTRLVAYIRAESIIDKVTLSEVVSVLQAAGGEKKRGRRRWWSVPREGLNRIESITGSAEPLAAYIERAPERAPAQTVGVAGGSGGPPQGSIFDPDIEVDHNDEEGEDYVF